MSRTLMLEAISACNLKCKFCAYKNEMTGESLEKRKMIEILNDVQKLNAENKFNPFLRVRLDGNTEPTLYKDFKWLIDTCGNTALRHDSENKFKINCVTNGLLLNEDIGRHLLINNVTIHVSMTGLTEKVYRGFQGSNLSEQACKKVLDSVKKNVSTLIKMKQELGSDTTIELRYILCEASVDEFAPYLDYWREEGASRVLVMGLGGNVLAAESHPIGSIVSRKQCRYFGKVLVKASGDVLLSCCNYVMDSVGNIYDKSFYDIMSSDDVMKIEAANINRDAANLPPICRGCRETHIYEESLTETDNFDFIKNPFTKHRIDFFEMSRHKKLIIWGAGNEFRIAQKKYLHNFKVEYIVDNNAKLWNTIVGGLVVKSPDVLKKEDKDNTVVLIASNYCFSIEAQLLKIGLKHYFSTVLFLDRYLDSFNHAADQIAIQLKV